MALNGCRLVLVGFDASGVIPGLLLGLVDVSFVKSSRMLIKAHSAARVYF